MCNLIVGDKSWIINDTDPVTHLDEDIIETKDNESDIGGDVWGGGQCRFQDRIPLLRVDLVEVSQKNIADDKGC